MFKTSQNAINLLKEFEGCSSKAKGQNVRLSQKDIACNIKVYPYFCSANHLTIGFGNRVIDDKKNLIYETNFLDGINVSECEKMFAERIANEDEESINRWLKVEVNQNQFDALVCLHYNRPIWAKKIIDSIINIGEKDNSKKIENMWTNFATINGVINQGLLNRRHKELVLYFKIC